MAVQLMMPECVREVPLGDPAAAIVELGRIVAELRGDADGLPDLATQLATESVENAVATGARLLAMVTPDNAAPAVLTGVPIAAPPWGREDSTEKLQDSLEDVGGPDVRETLALDTAVGQVVIAERRPGREQARDGKQLTLQLQAFIPEPGTRGMLLLTLACPSAHGWAEHEAMFTRIAASAHVPGAQETRRPAAPRPVDEESFEHRTYLEDA